MNNKISTIDFVKKYAMIIVLLLVLGIFTYKTDGVILAPISISNLISQNAYVFILGTGMLLCILTGGNIDLSVGSVVCFVGAIGAMLMVNAHVNMYLAILVMFLLGTAIGAFQAFWIAFVRIPPFITTLAGMLVFRGLSNVVLDGQAISITGQENFVKIFGGGADCFFPELFKVGGMNGLCLMVTVLFAALYVILEVRARSIKIAKDYQVDKLPVFLVKTILLTATIVILGVKLAKHKGIPTVLVWVFIVIFVYHFITSNTTVGRYFYAVGGNEKATRLSGINTNKVYFLAYTNMGFLAALASMVTIARMTSAQPTFGQNYEMDAIGACFIGGASAYGGIGTVPGVIIGALLMGIINLGMPMIGFDQNLQKVVKGGVLLVAVIFDVVSKRGGKFIVKN